MVKVILICWLVVVVMVYAALWFDTIYYRHDLPKVYRKILDTFTEEEE